MMSTSTMLGRYFHLPYRPSNSRFLHSSIPSLQHSLVSAIESKSFYQIPALLSTCPLNINPNPFSFLSSCPLTHQIQVLDDILQALIPLHPRSISHTTHSLLLSQTLSNPNTLPLSLAVLQCSIRSGCNLHHQTRLSLSRSWLINRSSGSVPVATILAKARSIGYPPDRNTCNYLLASLCAIDEILEAATVLRQMEPDAESFDIVIGSICRKRWTEAAEEVIREMVEQFGLLPRQRTVLRLVAAMRSNREVRAARDVLWWLEKEGLEVGFESYETVLKGCLERQEFVMAGEVVLQMAGKGYIPYLRTRQRVVEELTAIGEGAFASKVRQVLARLNS